MPSDQNMPKPNFSMPWPQPALDAREPAAAQVEADAAPDTQRSAGPRSRPAPESNDAAAAQGDLFRPRRSITGRFPKPGPRLGDQSMSRQEQLDDTQPGLVRKPWR